MPQPAFTGRPRRNALRAGVPRFDVGPNTAFWGLSAPSGALASQTHSSHGDRRAPPALWSPRRRVSSLNARARARHEAPSCRRGRDAANNRSPWVRRPHRRTASAPFSPPRLLGGRNRGGHPIRRPRRYRLGTAATTNSIVHYPPFHDRPSPIRVGHAKNGSLAFMGGALGPAGQAASSSLRSRPAGTPSPPVRRAGRGGGSSAPGRGVGVARRGAVGTRVWASRRCAASSMWPESAMPRRMALWFSLHVGRSRHVSHKACPPSRPASARRRGHAYRKFTASLRPRSRLRTQSVRDSLSPRVRQASGFGAMRRPVRWVCDRASGTHQGPSAARGRRVVRAGRRLPTGPGATSDTCKDGAGDDCGR